MTLIEKAKDFAKRAHDSIEQKRKFTKEPYWVHPFAVADIVASVTNDEEVIAAAYLHDVLEDVTPNNPEFSAETIQEQFGERVLKLVQELTDEFTKEAFPKLNRKERKAKEIERKATISKEAKTVKLADILHNTADIVANDPDFAKVYIREILDSLPSLSEGNSELLNRAALQTIMSFRVLGLEIPKVIAANP